MPELTQPLVTAEAAQLWWCPAPVSPPLGHPSSLRLQGSPTMQGAKAAQPDRTKLVQQTT